MCGEGAASSTAGAITNPKVEHGLCASGIQGHAHVEDGRVFFFLLFKDCGVVHAQVGLPKVHPREAVTGAALDCKPACPPMLLYCHADGQRKLHCNIVLCMHGMYVYVYVYVYAYVYICVYICKVTSLHSRPEGLKLFMREPCPTAHML